MKIVLKKLNLVICLILISFLFTNFCYAAFLKSDVNEKIKEQSETAGSFGYETSGNVLGLVQVVINAFLSLIGVLLLAYLLYAGYYWMTARGDEEKVTKAKDTIQRAIIGIIIIVAAYAISIFVMSRLEAGTLKGGGGTQQGPGAEILEEADPDRFNDPNAT